MKRSERISIETLYQPIVDIRTHKVLGYEALTRGKKRWHTPQTLFRHAYKVGGTVALDLACLHSAVQILPKLKNSELLFLNLEPSTLVSTFSKGEAGEKLLKKIAPYIKRVVFELTEGMKGRDFGRLRQGVHFLKHWGAGFAIDDVAGIGVKLFLLLSLKPHFLKIDMSLIRGLNKHRTHQELVHRIIALGKSIKAVLIAEGLEKKKDIDLIQRMGLRYGQGFYFGRPARHPSFSPPGPGA